jgi:hypothetical protein
MDRYNELATLMAKETTKITINTSTVNYDEAKQILKDLIQSFQEYFSELGSMESGDQQLMLVYGQIERNLNFLKDVFDSHTISTMKKKLHYFYLGWSIGYLECRLKQ